MTDYNKWERINASVEDDETDVAREKLRLQKEQMSDKEVRRIHECWEKPEFRAMFDEYAQEVSEARNPARLHARCLTVRLGSRLSPQVSDPKHKAETEAYLAQCEAEQRAAAGGGVPCSRHRMLGFHGLRMLAGAVCPDYGPPAAHPHFRR
jgi:hypothetical protein